MEYSYRYHIKLDKQPPAGLVDGYVAKIYCLELMFLDVKSKKQILSQQDTKCHEFVHSMIQTYCSLTSSVNQDQKHILDHLIHYDSTNWEEHKNWYHKLCHSAIDKNLSVCFVDRLWKNAPSCVQYSYIQNICDINNKQDGNAHLAVQKNN